MLPGPMNPRAEHPIPKNAVDVYVSMFVMCPCCPMLQLSGYGMTQVINNKGKVIVEGRKIATGL